MNNDINKNDIRVEEIKACGTFDETISVEIKDEAKLLIEAHDASPLAHKGILDSIKDKVDEVVSSVQDLEENMASISDMPKKVSDLENDLGFMNEERLASAVEIMGLVNGSQFESKINEVKTELQNNTIMSSNAILAEVHNVESKIPDADAIMNCMSKSTKYINMTPPNDGGTVTMPANGILYVMGTNSSSSNGWFYIVDAEKNHSRIDINYIHPTQTRGMEIPVRKGEVIQINYGLFIPKLVMFCYLKGSLPKEEEGGEEQE